MAGLADLFGVSSGSGGMFGGPATGGGMYGDMLTPEQKQALAYRGLMAAAAALGQAAMPSRMPIPIGAALGQAAGAMGEAQDKGAETALKATLYGLQGQQMKAKLGLMNQYANDTPPPMFASTPSGAPQPVAPAPVAPGADTLGSGGVPKAVSTMTADATMDPVQRAFLDSIAGPESAGAYNIRYTPSGGTTFAGYDTHPNIPEPGPQGPSTAAGRYQIVNSTWKPLAGQLGLSDFSPVSQDQAAWTLASDTYQKSTGRDLLADLKAGKMDQIPSALGGQWPTIRKALPAFAANLAKYGAAGGDTTLPAVPDFSGMLSGNQGPGYAPAAAEPTVPGNLNPGNFNVGRLIMDPSVPNTPAGRAAAAPMSQLSAGYADAVSKGFRGTIQDYAQQQQAAPQAATAGAPAAQPGPLAQLFSPPTGGIFGAPPAPPASTMFGQPAAMPMGGIDPAYVQWAQRRANLGSLLGVPTPAYLNEAAGMPFVAPKAAATAGAQYPYDVGKIREAAAADIAKAGPIGLAQALAKWYEPQQLRPGTGIADPSTGRITTAMPQLEKVVDPVTGQESYKYVTPPTSGGAPGPQASASGGLGVAALGPGQREALVTRAKAEQEQRQKVIDEASAAQASRATLLNMENEAGNFRQGPFASHYQTAAKYLRLIDPSWSGQVASYEDFVKNAGQLTRQAVRETSSRAAVQEFNMIANTLPSPEQSPIGLRRVQNELIGLTDFRLAKAQAQQQYEQASGGIGNVSGFETQFQKQASPYAFIVARMDPADRKEMIAKLQGSAQGRQELARLGEQLTFLKQSGLAQ